MPKMFTDAAADANLGKIVSSGMLEFGDLKVGVLGIVTETASEQSTCDPLDFAKMKIIGLQQKMWKKYLVEASRELRKNGAKAVILLAHVMNDCDVGVVVGPLN